ncbi:MAG TPA: MBL fold metallo-hydrolase [Thermoplasmata archaeon]|nr:MBL fold metallo-hydrolase [Thermoplasmata archaeon]
MGGPVVVELGEGRLLLDLDFRDHEGLVGAYLLPRPEGYALVETGPTSCHAALLAGLDRAGVERAQVTEVFVTHIHLDHAGGVGALAAALPRATFYAHESGVRHLVDPSRLSESARRAWGPASDRLWGAVVPIAADRIRAVVGGERWPLARGELVVVPTPGHAKHHVSFVDTGTRSILAGDSAGVWVEGLARPRPAIPPPDLDLEALYASLDRMVEAQPERILFTHFGPAPGAVDTLVEYRRTVESWSRVGLEAALESPTVEHVAARLEAFEADAAARSGRPAPAEDRGGLVSGYDLAAQGLLRYFRTHGRIG